MRRLILTCFTIASVLLFSCQQEIDPNILSNPPSGGGTGGGTTGNTANSYHPLTAGSYWKYKDSATSAITTMTATNHTVTKNNILYTIITATNTSQTDTILAASPKPNYYYNVSGASPNTGAPFDLVMNYLNDTASVGYQWQYTAGQGNGFTAYFHCSIVEKNITVNIGGHSYSNVIHTHMLLSYDIFGMPMDYVNYDYYIARGIGILRIRSNLSALGSSFETCSDITDYHIN
jgi:hypothetical protein